MQEATFTLRRTLSGKTLKAWRKAHNLSAHELAIKLGVSRSYVKSIEGGSLAASQKIIQRFNELRAESGEDAIAAERPETITIISRFRLPRVLEILAKPRRCKGCHKDFVPVTPNQRTHSDPNCKRAARRRKVRRK